MRYFFLNIGMDLGGIEDVLKIFFLKKYIYILWKYKLDMFVEILYMFFYVKFFRLVW